MADLSQNVFAKNLFILLKETFEGPGGSVGREQHVDWASSWRPQVGDSMAIVAHTAYHLGAIRHALKSFSPPSPSFCD